MKTSPSPAARCLLLLLLLLLLLAAAADAGRLLWEMKERVRQVQLQRAEQLLLATVSRSGQRLGRVTQGWLDQQLDHFNPQDPRTFPQRFLVNDVYWKKAGGPVFLFIGGEGPLYKFDVSIGHHVEMAERHGALLVALEHRFYGHSVNPDGLKTENLARLSSRQALVDLAVFREHIGRSFNLSGSHTWISFGGSYAGALSAWLKREFPHLVFAAVASSAPVRAKLDFSAYSNVVGLGLSNQRVGGSVKCFSMVRKAFAALEAALTGNVGRVAADFNCCRVPKDLDDQFTFLQSLADIFMGTVQYNGEFFSIDQICDVMANRTRGYSGLVRLVQMFSVEGRCLDASYENMLKELKDTTVGRGSYRQWIYQTCTEFGFYQTCEDPMCPFSRRFPLGSYTDVCQSVFGISQRSLPGRVAFSNMYYGGERPTTRRVLYVNGEIDPWRALSVAEGCAVDGEKALTVVIRDAAHCADMMADRAGDRVSLALGRQEIEKFVADWLETAEEERTEGRCA